MNRYSQLLTTLLCALIPYIAFGQNTLSPAPIQTYYSTFWNSDVFVSAIPRFALGHQWGAARLDKVNTALRMNVTCSNWGYLDSNYTRLMHKLGKGDNDTNYLVWADPLWKTSGRVGDLFRQPWRGMRWEPAENAGLGREWHPRDEDSWPFSFGAKHHGTIANGSGSVNYRRFMLDTAMMPGYPVRVLDSVEPRNYFRIYSPVNWRNFMEERFVRTTVPIYNDSIPQTYVDAEYVIVDDWTQPVETIIRAAPVDSSYKDSIEYERVLYRHDVMDGRRLQLVLNMRRTSSTDTVMDDAPILTVEVPYHMRWKDQDSLRYPNSFVNTKQRMPFRKVPYGHADSTFALPLSRGLEMKMRTLDLESEFMDTILITRRMLPRHSDAGGPDITFVAEFRTDSIIGVQVENGDTTFGIRRGRMLKTGYFDFPAKSDTNLVVMREGILDSTKFNQRYRAIDSLGITIWYHGNSAVAIRSASILTPMTKRATSGYHDTALANRFKAHRDSIKRQIDTVEAHTGRTIRLLGFYGNDEFDIDQLVGMRYKLAFLDRRLTSETGFSGARTVNDNLRTGYGKQKLHGWPSRFLWTAGPTMQERATAAPYVARLGVYEGASAAHTPIPAPILSLKSGYRWASTRAPFRSYESDVNTNLFGSYQQISLPFPSAPNNYNSMSAYEEYIHSNSATLGPCGMHEHNAYAEMYQTGD